MNKLIIIILVIVCFPACKNERTMDIEEKLIGNQYKYWLFVKDFPSLDDTLSISGFDESVYMAYFDKDGKYYDMHYYYEPTLGGRMKNDKDYDNLTDIIRSHTWILKNDNILILNGLNYSIKQLDTDILIIQNPRTDIYSLYIVAPDRLIPKEFQKMQ
uniref:hypothetical protein n=1 Tax=uncultured Dysgonomonas sp. TaxID=206096 RepID=UPI00260E5BA4|nr:hypothetical protein [uncultured Dysgonomonas sp.]